MEKECNSCEQDWDNEYFCIICSNHVEFMDDYNGDEIEVNSGDVCFNCCHHNLG